MRKAGGFPRLQWCTFDTPLGCMTAAQSSDGVCAFVFCEQPQAGLSDLQARLYRRFAAGGLAGPQWQQVQADDNQIFLSLQQWVNAFFSSDPLAAVDSPRIPLDLGGTPFQQRVWSALQQLPAGSRLSYAALAERLNAPGSSRAVANACAANPCALLVPCHRIVGADGQLRGYRWGEERKRRLLQWESERISATVSLPKAGPSA